MIKYFTFGSHNGHQFGNITLGLGTALKVESENPRATMFEHFTDQWTFEYDQPPQDHHIIDLSALLLSMKLGHRIEIELDGKTEKGTVLGIVNKTMTIELDNGDVITDEAEQFAGALIERHRTLDLEWVTNIYANNDAVHQEYVSNPNMVLGTPKGSDRFSVQDLRESNIIGVYRKVEA